MRGKQEWEKVTHVGGEEVARVAAGLRRHTIATEKGGAHSGVMLILRRVVEWRWPRVELGSGLHTEAGGWASGSRRR